MEELRTFGGRNFPSSLKHRWAATRRRLVLPFLPVMAVNKKHDFRSNIKYFSWFCGKIQVSSFVVVVSSAVKKIHSKSRTKQHI